MAQSSGDRHPWFYVGVLLTCACGLMLQIMETRILSVIGYYYLAFFAIGVGMLGMTAGALLVFYRAEQSYPPQRLFELMSKIMAAFAWSTLISLVVLLSLTLGAETRKTLQFFAEWLVALAVLLPPYVLLGAAVSLALTRSDLKINIVYGVDLVGASAGCLLTLGLLTITDTYTAILLVGAVGGLAGWTFHRAAGSIEPGPSSLSRLFLKPGVAVAALLTVAGVNQALGAHGLRPTLIKGLVEYTANLTEERWNSFSRIALWMRPQTEAFMWSPSSTAPKPVMDQGHLNIDGMAGTPMYRYRGDPRELDFLRYDTTAFAYYIRNQGRSAVIGIGGGRDLMTSSVFGFRDITGVEYNPIFVKLFLKDYADFTGSAHVQGLRLVTDDARSWFARSNEHFDLVQMSLIDTFAATGAGAFTLSENGLYTVQGWKRFMSRLTPTGVFTVSRWYAPNNADETARILSIAMAALIEMGVERPADHIYLIGNVPDASLRLGALSNLLVARAPFTPAELKTLDETAARLNFDILAAPGRASADPTFDRILRARTTDELVQIGRSTPLNLAPTWDSNPFFFNQLRLSDPASVQRARSSAKGVIHGNLTASLTLLALVLVSAVVVAVVVLAPARSAALRSDRPTLMWGSAYFLAIGVGFMFVEMSLIQRMSLFLGHPVYGLAIVLFSVILATGIGSLVSERAMPLSPLGVAIAPLTLTAYLVTLPLWLGGVLDATEPGSLLLRAGVCLAVIVPAGMLMGFMFPTGMRLCSRIDTRITPWLWAVNGAAGVMASGAAVLVSIESSLNVALWVGAAFYAALAGIAYGLLRLGDGRAAPAQSLGAPLAVAG